jgi:hypothetical protein
MPLHRLEGQDFQQQQVQRALNQILRFAHGVLGYRAKKTAASLGNQGIWPSAAFP